MIDQTKWNPEFKKRFAGRYDELKWLYCELYKDNIQGFEWLCNSMFGYYKDRKTSLKKLDRIREKNPDWYRGNDLLGMMMYTDAFAGTLKGVEEKLDYIKSCNVNCLHLMPLMESPKGKDDGGYAIADFRKVQPELGTIDDLTELTDKCHENGINCCLDFVMNHTSEDHAWAKAARAGDPEARKRYFFYDNWDIPVEFEKTVPQVFPTTAPGNFTWFDDCKKVVMTTFYPYQWDLNYANCVVFNDMVGNMLFMANCGIDIIRLDAVPYIWKELNTSCRNLPQVHTLVRMMRLISEIVCPGILLLGEVVMEPAKVVPYFGTIDKPECHMLYNVTTMASTWNTIATKDVGLLKRQLDQVFSLPKDYVFLNYLRCHDDIGWGLDYEWMKWFGTKEVEHKKFLNNYFTGNWYGSPSRGELYNDDPRLGDARLCGTTASLSGLEEALYEKNADKTKTAIECILMLHSYLFTQSGIPMLYSGDEIGQENDYSYKQDAYKWADSRYLHRGKFPWKQLNTPVSQKIFKGLDKLEQIRANKDVFKSDANVCTLDLGSAQVLGIKRWNEKSELIAFFNFSNSNAYVNTDVLDASCKYIDLITKKVFDKNKNELKPYAHMWLYRETE